MGKGQSRLCPNPPHTFHSPKCRCLSAQSKWQSADKRFEKASAISAVYTKQPEPSEPSTLSTSLGAEGMLQNFGCSAPTSACTTPLLAAGSL